MPIGSFVFRFLDACATAAAGALFFAGFARKACGGESCVSRWPRFLSFDSLSAPGKARYMTCTSTRISRIDDRKSQRRASLALNFDSGANLFFFFF